MMRWVVMGALVWMLAPTLYADDLTVLTPETAGGPPRQMLSRLLKKEALEALARRQAVYEAVKTPQEMRAYQERLRREFLAHLGVFPERAPLNARVVNTYMGDRYRREKIVFESQPNHHVTAVLYLPAAGEPPFPVVVMPCGHSSNGKAENQMAGIFLARSGLACLCYDPIGQGERHQFLDSEGKVLFRPTTEHTLVGAGSIPLGRNTATFRIWDGMRALDYVASRKDLDAKRIGVTGCSGGGTLTSYLMALDERVACAAPSCYLTSFGRLLDTLGPQDAEQNIHGQLAFGLDHADYILMRAPRPTLILAATQDFFDIRGTWDSFRQAKRFYTRQGLGERVELIETDTKHGYPRPQREAMVRWMRRWLMGKEEPVTEPEILPRPVDELRCTPRGEVMLLDGARSVVDLNIAFNAQLEKKRRTLWEGRDHARVLDDVRRLAGIRRLADLPRLKPIATTTLERSGYQIAKLVLESEPGNRLPALLYQPARLTGDRYLYLHSGGKHVEGQPGGPIEKLVRAGHLVLAVDVRGTGETGPTEEGLYGGNSSDFFTAYLLGKSLVGMRAEDVLGSARTLAEWHTQKGAQPVKVRVIAVGGVGPAALHAVVLEPALFAHLTLIRSLPSWSDLVRYPQVPGQLVNTVHGALHVYDLPDLVHALPATKVTLQQPLDLAALTASKRK